jgi:hypothetical protein
VGGEGLWRQLEGEPPCLEGHAAVAWRGGLLVFGGVGLAQEYSSGVFLYGAGEKVWRKVKAAGGIKGRANFAAEIMGDTLFVFGGQSDSGVLHDFYSFDILK